MLSLIFIILTCTTSNTELFDKVARANGDYLSDASCPFAFTKERAEVIVKILKDGRAKVMLEIAKQRNDFCLSEQGNIKMIERIDFPYNSIRGLIWGSDFAYSYEISIGSEKIKVHKIKKNKLGESGISSDIIKEVSNWNLKLLKRMIFMPVDKWNKNYVDLLDSLKAHTSYNLAKTGDAFFLATSINFNKKEPVIATVAFDGF